MLTSVILKMDGLLDTVQIYDELPRSMLHRPLYMAEYKAET